MKVVNFIYREQKSIGVLGEDEKGNAVVYDLCLSDPSIPVDMRAFLQQGKDGFQKAREVVNDTGSSKVSLSKVKLEAPVSDPEKIICVGINYRDHAEETGKTIPDYPTIFSKYASSVIGASDAIRIPRVTKQIDWECELAVIIGETCRHVSMENALDFVAGYTAANDVSARDYQMRTTQWTIGKTFDTFCPLGPALVTKDEIPDPGCLDISMFVDDELVQHSNTRELIFPVPYLVSYLSEVMTLKPGDVILTGTPSGVGFARSPQRFLKPGQTCRVEIESIGSLVNSVKAEA